MKDLVGQYVRIKDKYSSTFAYVVYYIAAKGVYDTTPYYKITHKEHWTLVPIDELIEKFDFISKIKAILYE